MQLLRRKFNSVNWQLYHLLNDNNKWMYISERLITKQRSPFALYMFLNTRFARASMQDRYLLVYALETSVASSAIIALDMQQYIRMRFSSTW